jgi:hypothetical protein
MNGGGGSQFDESKVNLCKKINPEPLFVEVQGLIMFGI